LANGDHIKGIFSLSSPYLFHSRALAVKKNASLSMGKGYTHMDM
jgi:hypothetical protein